MTKKLKELKKVSGRPIERPKLFILYECGKRSDLLRKINESAPPKANSFLIGNHDSTNNYSGSLGMPLGLGTGSGQIERRTYYAVQYYQGKQ